MEPNLIFNLKIGTWYFSHPLQRSSAVQNLWRSRHFGPLNKVQHCFYPTAEEPETQKYRVICSLSSGDSIRVRFHVSWIWIIHHLEWPPRNSRFWKHQMGLQAPWSGEGFVETNELELGQEQRQSRELMSLNSEWYRRPLLVSENNFSLDILGRNVCVHNQTIIKETWVPHSGHITMCCKSGTTLLDLKDFYFRTLSLLLLTIKTTSQYLKKGNKNVT